MIRYLFILLLLQSCSCDYHLRKAQKKCGSTIIRDTITVKDTVLINSIHTDTLFKSSVGDTVYIEKDRLKIKYVRLAGDSVFISGKCDTLKIPVEVKVPVEKIVLKPQGNKWMWWLIVGAFIVGVLVRFRR